MNEMLRGFLVLLQALAIILPASAYAANIYIYDPLAVGQDDNRLSKDLLNGSIIIDGPIEYGDYEKFIEVVADAGSYKGHVFISSRGGNVAAAISIGHLIRALRFTTEVPMQSSRGGGHCLSDILSECICASACVLVYLGGVEREGNLLAIHRTFIRHDELGDLSFGQAERAGRQQAAVVDQYLSDMGAPSALSELMRSIPSSGIQILSTDFVEQYLRKLPEIEEWLTAKCGNEDEILEKRRLQGLEPHDGEWSEHVACVKNSLEFARAEAFYPALLKSIDIADPNLMSEDLRAFAENREFDLLEMLGKNLKEITTQLKWVGLGSPSRRTPSDIIMNGMDNGGVRIFIAGETDTTVSSIGLSLTQYTGPVTGGTMAQDITPQWLGHHFGQPIDVFGSRWNEHLIIALFSPPGENLAAVAFVMEDTGKVTSLRLCQSRASSHCSTFFDALP